MRKIAYGAAISAELFLPPHFGMGTGLDTLFARQSGKALLVCIVEDDEAVRAAMRLLLETAGYLVPDFASAEAFLDAGPEHGAHCLLLDRHLKGMSGLEVLELLRARGDRTPALAVTAAGRHPEGRYRKAGAVAVLAKPPAPKALLDWIRRATSDT